MIFEGADGALGGVATMGRWRDKLEVDSELFHFRLHGFGNLVVEALKKGTETTGCKKCEHAFVCSDHFWCAAILHGLGMDVIAVVVVHNEEIVVA